MQIEADGNFSKYGIDSIMIMELNGILDKDFSDLPSTLFFEYSSIAGLTGFFMEHHAGFFQQPAGEAEREMATGDGELLNGPAPQIIADQAASEVFHAPCMQLIPLIPGSGLRKQLAETLR